VRFLSAAAHQIIGLFVGDWLQSIVVVLILAAGWFAVSRFGLPALVILVVLLAGQLVWFAYAEGLKQSRRRSPS